MIKWVWRFRNENNSLWTRVIKAMHGQDGQLGDSVRASHSSVWLDIVHEVRKLKNQGIDLLNLIKKKVGNGEDTLFWKDIWRGDSALETRFPRIFALESCRKITVADKLNHENLGSSLRRIPRSGVENNQFAELVTNMEGVQLPMMKDRWVWELEGSGEFSVASARRFIEDKRMTEVFDKTRWVKSVPLKVNIFAWKVSLDGLPTRFNLSRRGLDIQSILCPNCDLAAESTRHIFFGCPLARKLYCRIAKWWNVILPEVTTYEEWLLMFSNIPGVAKCKEILEGVFYTMWWLLWNFRNKVLFGSKIPAKDILFDEIQERSYYWSRFRCKAKFSWVEWLKNPSTIIV